MPETIREAIKRHDEEIKALEKEVESLVEKIKTKRAEIEYLSDSIREEYTEYEDELYDSDDPEEISRYKERMKELEALDKEVNILARDADLLNVPMYAL